jgi:hypothetical protein
MNKSESIAALAAAYSKAQPKIEGAVKDKTNPAFRSKYADLGSVVEAIKPALAEHGLSFVQCPHDAEHAAKVETILLHESGEWMSLGELSVPVTKIDAHGFGSALTYARRYGLLAAFGVAPEDDDGNAATERAPAKPVAAAKPPTKPTAEQETRALDWVAALDECADLDALKAKFEQAVHDVHAFGFPMLDNLLIAAKDRRKANLTQAGRKAA